MRAIRMANQRARTGERVSCGRSVGRRDASPLREPLLRHSPSPEPQECHGEAAQCVNTWKAAEFARHHSMIGGIGETRSAN